MNLQFLPPYSPMLNQVEYAFSKIKSVMRNVLSIPQDDLLQEAIRQGVAAITSVDCANYVMHTFLLCQRQLQCSPFINIGKELLPSGEDTETETQPPPVEPSSSGGDQDPQEVVDTQEMPEMLQPQLILTEPSSSGGDQDPQEMMDSQEEAEMLQPLIFTEPSSSEEDQDPQEMAEMLPPPMDSSCSEKEEGTDTTPPHADSRSSEKEEGTDMPPPAEPTSSGQEQSADIVQPPAEPSSSGSGDDQDPQEMAEMLPPPMFRSPNSSSDCVNTGSDNPSTANKSAGEETETNKDVTDSGYSNSCSNSQSQRSGSSKSSGRNSAGSSGSRGSAFCVLASTIDADQKDCKDRKDKKKDESKKSKRKKTRSSDNSSATAGQKPQLSSEDDSTFSGDVSFAIPAKPSMSQQMDSGIDENVFEAAALSQTLHSLRKMKYQDINSDDSEGSAKCGMAGSLKNLRSGGHPSSEIAMEQIASIKSDGMHEGELKVAVSMLDGVVIYTMGLTQALGYPKDMWIGRSLIDFVLAKHKASFASFIIQSIYELRPECSPANSQRKTYFCCLRKYRELKQGFQITSQPVRYLPCQISLELKELPSVGESFLKECLIITASPVQSAYEYPDETRVLPKFTTRHSVTCQLVHVDPQVTSYFGYTPQDMLGRSVLDFYHPEDLHFLKEVYEAVIKEQGHPFRSKPYRFLCQNGCYALVETELSAFMNPWTRQLEFIIGRHSVLRGPSNPDVITPCLNPEPLNFPEDVLKEAKIVQEGIKCLLNETIAQSTETAKQQVSKRCKDLAAFMENLMDKITQPPDLKVVVPTEEQSFSERDSVMLGEISPHHDYYDSKSISETPPSYNQLNYNENIHRFFESKPKTTVSDESSGCARDDKTGSSRVEEKTSTTLNWSSGSKSGDSGDSSGQSTGSNGNSGETSNQTSTSVSNNTSRNEPEVYKAPALTKQLLSRHNEDMEKQMVQKHRVSRTKSDRDSTVKDRLKIVEKLQEIKNFGDDPSPGILCQGVKRSGSHSWDGEPFKTIKATHTLASQDQTLQHHQQQSLQHHEPLQICTDQKLTTSQQQQQSGSVSSNMPVPMVVTASPHVPAPSLTSNIWTPFPLGSPAPVPTCSPQEFPCPAVPGALLPMCYPIQNKTGSELTSSAQNPMDYSQSNVQVMSNMLYQPFMYGTPPIHVYSPLMYPSAAFNMNNGAHKPSPHILAHLQNAQAIKAEPAGDPQPIFPSSSSQVPIIGGQSRSNKKLSDNEGGSNEISTPYDDSSYQSSFYSLLKTDKSDESMRSCSENEKETGWDGKRETKCRPVRKVAPWVENIDMTPALVMQYQLKERGLEDILRDDAAALERIKQPSLVNEQLSRMYQDLELEGLPKSLVLEEGMTSSSESSGDDIKVSKCSSAARSSLKRRRRYMEYDKMTILFEEDAPMPPPILAQCQ